MEYIFLVLAIIFAIDGIDTILHPWKYLREVAELEEIKGHRNAVPQTPIGRFLASGSVSGVLFYLAYYFW